MFVSIWRPNSIFERPAGEGTVEGSQLGLVHDLRSAAEGRASLGSSGSGVAEPVAREGRVWVARLAEEGLLRLTHTHNASNPPPPPLPPSKNPRPPGWGWGRRGSEVLGFRSDPAPHHSCAKPITPLGNAGGVGPVAPLREEGP